jgi:hypothetical protein
MAEGWGTSRFGTRIDFIFLKGPDCGGWQGEKEIDDLDEEQGGTKAVDSRGSKNGANGFIGWELVPTGAMRVKMASSDHHMVCVRVDKALPQSDRAVVAGVDTSLTA